MLSFSVRDLEAMVYVTVEVHKLCCTFCDHKEVAEKKIYHILDLTVILQHSKRAHPTHLETESEGNEPTEIWFLHF